MQTTTKRHPIRGFFYGIFFGLGLTLVVVGQGIAALGTWPPFIVFVVGIVIGTLWSTFGPAKKPKGPPPAGATMVTDDPPVAPPAEPVPVAAEAGEEFAEEAASAAESAGSAADADSHADGHTGSNDEGDA